jgi:hypothetical protein
MSFFNPYAEAREFEIKLALSGAGSKRSVQLSVNGREQLDVDLSDKARDFPLKVRLLPGPNHFDLDSVEPAVRLSTERRQLRMFAVHGSSIRVVDPAAETAK